MGTTGLSSGLVGSGVVCLGASLGLLWVLLVVDGGRDKLGGGVDLFPPLLSNVFGLGGVWPGLAVKIGICWLWWLIVELADLVQVVFDRG